MDFIRNFPFFSIMLGMFSAIVTSVLKKKAARILTLSMLFLQCVIAAVLLFYTHASGESFIYMMGHFPAPWGNEIRAGELEAVMALFVCIVAFFSVLAGFKAIEADIEGRKINLYYILVDMIVSSIIAMIYTNDLFTGYVFIEINTISACGLIMIRQTGKTVVTAIRYMIVSLLGSGLFLIGVSLLYTITGHLLMSNIKETVAGIAADSDSGIVLTVIIGLMTVGLSIKSGLFPFHLWIPDAYGYSNVTSSSILSSIVSKGYIFLLIKIYYRVIGIDVIKQSGVLTIVFILGAIAVIAGSVFAIMEHNFRKMIAYSSVAQIGYIFMSMGLGTDAAFAAAAYHIIAHGFIKCLLFLSSAEFTAGSHTRKIEELIGMGRKKKAAAIIFAIGAFSISGFPLLAGFPTKVFMSQASIGLGIQTPVTIIVLAVSTILNAAYFLRVVIYMFLDRPNEKLADVYIDDSLHTTKRRYYFSLTVLVLINFALGIFSSQIMEIISNGLKVFE